MKHNRIYVITIAFYVALTGLFYGCKREISSIEKGNPDKEKAIQRVVEKYGNVGRSVIMPINKSSENLFYRNKDGILIKTSRKENKTEAADCSYNCSNTNNPNDIIATYTLQYIQRNYDCGSATLSSLVAQWIISVPYTPLYSDPNNTSNLSYGEIDMYPFSGPPVSSGSLTNINIRNLGSDPNCTGHTIYEITSKWELDDDLIFGDFAQASLALYNDCGLLGNLHSTGMVTGNPIPNSPYEDMLLNPCERVDKVWVGPPFGYLEATALASYNLCYTFPNGFIPTDYQQVQWRAATSSTSYHWDDQASTIGNYIFDAWTGFIYLTNMTNNSGTWLVRYRNLYSSNGCGNQNATWTIYVTEIWNL